MPVETTQAQQVGYKDAKQQVDRAEAGVLALKSLATAVHCLVGANENGCWHYDIMTSLDRMYSIARDAAEQLRNAKELMPDDIPF